MPGIFIPGQQTDHFFGFRTNSALEQFAPMEIEIQAFFLIFMPLNHLVIVLNLGAETSL